jgi:hypothetical protein
MLGTLDTRRAAMVLAVLACFALPQVSKIALAQERPVAPEVNPPGDIPDSQVFVTYRSAAGFSIKVPEGWARTERPNGAAFADKYGSVDLAVAPTPGAPTAQTVRKKEAAVLQKTGQAVRIAGVHSVALPAGSAVVIVYTSNSEPNAVTDKQIRLENNRYLLYRAGQEIAITFSAPAGADNADQWQLMASSFRWNQG